MSRKAGNRSVRSKLRIEGFQCLLCNEHSKHLNHEQPLIDLMMNLFANAAADEHLKPERMEHDEALARDVFVGAMISTSWRTARDDHQTMYLIRA